MYELSESLVFEGVWWLPSNPDHKIHGTVAFEPGEYIRFDLTDRAFSAFKDEFPSSEQVVIEPLVKGITDVGKYVSLLNCKELLSDLGHYEVKLVVISQEETYFEDLEKPNVSRVIIDYTYLNEWLGDYFPFRTEEQLSGFSLNYQIPEPVVISIDAIDAELYFSYVLRRASERFKLTLEQSAFIGIDSTNPNNIHWFLEQAQHVQRLLAILTGEPVRKRSLQIRYLTVQDGVKREHQAHVLYSIAPIPPIDLLLPIEMLMSAKDLEHMLPEVVRAWFEPTKNELLKLLSDLYLTVRYNKESPLKFQFLSLVQALETYHREKWKATGSYFSIDEFGPYLNELVTFVDAIEPKVHTEEHEEKLIALKEALRGQDRSTGDKGVLDYANEFSLSQRIKALANWLNEGLNSEEDFTQEIPINKRFRRKTVDTRNYFTHYGEHLRQRIFKPEELYFACKILSNLLAALILKELGIPNKAIKEALRRRQYTFSL